MATHCPKCDSENPDTQSFCGNCGTRLDSSKDIPSVTKTLETPVQKLSIGTTFADRYKILEELGKGGMGEVYKVRDKKLDEEMALKLLRPEIAFEKSTLERFRNELKLARKITHMNVCRMFDFHEEEGTPYITMEYVPGEDLKSLIQKKEKLLKEEALDIAKQVCEGLDVAYKLGIVHRDLKPQNIMIDENGNAKIMDFGIARSVGAEGLTEAGMIIGTPDYISPEQAEGEEADHRSDIYSLGVILYEMVTGTVPFKGDTALSVALKHKSQFPLDPRKLNPDVSDDLSRLILICLEKDRERRYQTAEALLNDLRNIEEGLPLGTKIQPRRATFVQTLIRRKLFIPATIIALVIIAVAIWQFLPQGETVSVPKIENSIAIISFENQTGDEALNQLQKIIPNLLITNLENTGFFYVATWERMKDILKQMDKGDVDIITSDVGFQACQREGIKALILGSFAKVGETFVTDVKVLDVETKRLLNSASSRGEGEDSIFSQIDELSEKISEGMEISQQKIDEAQLNISEVTTTSLEAYKYFIQGREDYEKYYWDEARQSFEKAVILDPEFAMAYLYLARFARGESKKEAYEKAKAYSENTAEKERLYIEASYSSVIERNREKGFKIIKELTQKYPKEKRAHYQLGKYYQNFIGNFDKALEEYKKALELDSSYGLPLNESAFIHLRSGNYEKAIECLKKYVTIRPGEANPLDSLAWAYFLLGRLDESVAKYKEAMEIRPGRMGSYFAISYINALREDYTEAMKWVDQYIPLAKSVTSRSVAHLLKGFYHFWLGRMDQSLGEIQSARIIADSEGDHLVRSYADWMALFVYREKGEHELARESWKNYFDFFKSYAPAAYYNIVKNVASGKLEIKEGRFESAKARLSDIKSLLPEIDALGRWGFKLFHDSLYAEILLAEGSFDEAVAVGEKLNYKLSPDYPWDIILNNVCGFNDVVARAYQQKGDLDKAIAEYERLMTIDLKDRDRRLIHPLYHYKLATLYEQKGWKDKAIDQYEIFLDLWKDADPVYAELEDARQRLAALRNQ
ncbi:MAG: protein kinase [Candidatus Aminicenantes bacterium]|jgi:serine/threonine protein kinase/Flp pilus assembly protein TadD